MAASNLDELVREYKRVRECYTNGDNLPILTIMISAGSSTYYLQDRRVLSQKFVITCTLIYPITITYETMFSVNVTLEQRVDDLKLQDDVRTKGFWFDFHSIPECLYYLGENGRLEELRVCFNDYDVSNYSFGGPEILITPSVDVEALILPNLLP